MSAVGTSSPYGDASVQNGPTSSQSSVWPTTVKSKYNGWLLDGNYGNTGGTGSNKLSLPFVSGGAQPFEISDSLHLPAIPRGRHYLKSDSSTKQRSVYC